MSKAESLFAGEEKISLNVSKSKERAVTLLKGAYDLIGQAEMEAQSTPCVLRYHTLYAGVPKDGFDWLDDVRDFLVHLGEET